MKSLNRSKKRVLARTVVFLLALLSSPFLCYGGVLLIEYVPPASLPAGIDFAVNLFEEAVMVENKTGETLYITPITTTSGQPEVISQLPRSLKQRDIPLKPNRSIEIEYDAADSRLAGIIVCREDGECRLLEASSSDVLTIETFDGLLALEPSWLEAVRAYSRYDLTVPIMLGLCFVPIVLFSFWWYLGRSAKVG